MIFVRVINSDTKLIEIFYQVEGFNQVFLREVHYFS